MAKASHLKDKTDAQCRELAAHYYGRAKKAEKDLAAANLKIAEIESKMREMRLIARDLIDVD